MKKYMGYLPIGLLCLIVLFSQLIYTRRNDFHVALSTIAQEGERIGDPEAIRDFAYSFYIADTNFSSSSTMSQNAWRVDAVGDSSSCALIQRDIRTDHIGGMKPLIHIYLWKLLCRIMKKP